MAGTQEEVQVMTRQNEPDLFAMAKKELGADYEFATNVLETVSKKCPIEGSFLMGFFYGLIHRIKELEKARK